MGLLGLAGSLLGMIPKVGSPGGKKKGKSGGSKGKSSKKSSKKKGSTKKKQRKSNKKKKKKKRRKKKKKWGKFFTKARKLKNSLSKSKLVKRAKKAIKKAILTTKKVVQKTKAAVTKAKQQVKTAVQQTKQVVKEKVLPTPATKKPTNNSSAKAKASSVDKNRITSEAELKALLDEHRKTRVIGSDGEPITTLIDKRKVLSAESTATPDGLAPYVVLGSKMSYALFIEDYLKLSDANAPIKENFEAGLSLINPVRKVKKGEEALESIKNMEKVIEETYGLANNSKKAKDAQTTQKEIDQLGEYVKKLDKGTGKVGDFRNLEGTSIDEIISRIPSDASRRELKPVEGKVTEGFEYKWTQDGKTMRVRVHGPDPSAPPGSNAAKGWIVRVQEGKKYLDPVTGEYQPPGISKSDSPFYNEDLANRTHIPIKSPD
ncbi:polymorphic toxin type 30 domain-containing protein [Lysinibacillus sp. FSL L8-0312]|uniref:polymorphic toxin type 30 domain-containing protein n=1 Tax=Lysinibacillus sp. FSL L8-0312 TaxID=2921521 RepID=UPI0030F4D4EB